MWNYASCTFNNLKTASWGKVAAFLRGREVLGSLGALLLCPISAIADPETLLVSILGNDRAGFVLWFLTSLEPWSPWKALVAGVLFLEVCTCTHMPEAPSKPWVRWSLGTFPALVSFRVLKLLWHRQKGKVHYLNSGEGIKNTAIFHNSGCLCHMLPSKSTFNIV